MNALLTQLIVWLNAAATWLAGILLAPVAWMPGWLSATIIAIVTGILMLVVFKYTSNQTAIKNTRNQIKANLLGLSLFKDEMRVVLRCQGRLLLNAVRLLTLSAVPMLVMLVPMCLLLGQLAVWYQARPISVGEEAVVTVQLADNVSAEDIELVAAPGAEMRVGPVRVPAKHMVCWKFEAREAGAHELEFKSHDQLLTKQMAVGASFMPVSMKRPAWDAGEVLLHPLEQPFLPDSPVQSIEVNFPERSSWTAGTNTWVIYWFLMSMVAAFVARPLLHVNI